ncbi:MAG: hypothetical protein RQ751_07390 [Longimicrobiales bacterium]|nr:hypothetical protein [Longimicrobiales bacterium]
MRGVRRARALPLLLAAAAAGGCGDLGRGGGGAAADPGFDLVFYSDRSGRGDLFLISSNDFRTGRFSPRRLVGTPLPDYAPRWVPDGPGLVFLTRVEDPPGLYGLAPDADGISLRLAEAPSGEDPPALTPDGTTLVYAAPTAEGSADLFARPLAGGAERRITTDGAPKAQPEVSPDGAWVVYTRGPAGAEDLMLARLDGTETRVLTEGPASDGNPVWLRDGSGILFDSDRTGLGTDVFHLDLESGVIRNLTNSRTADMVPDPSPDGAWVAFASSRGGSWDIYVMPMGGGAARQVTSETSFEGAPRWVAPGVFQFPGG